MASETTAKGRAAVARLSMLTAFFFVSVVADGSGIKHPAARWVIFGGFGWQFVSLAVFFCECCKPRLDEDCQPSAKLAEPMLAPDQGV